MHWFYTGATWGGVGDVVHTEKYCLTTSKISLRSVSARIPSLRAPSPARPLVQLHWHQDGYVSSWQRGISPRTTQDMLQGLQVQPLALTKYKLSCLWTQPNLCSGLGCSTAQLLYYRLLATPACSSAEAYSHVCLAYSPCALLEFHWGNIKETNLGSC